MRLHYTADASEAVGRIVSWYDRHGAGAVGRRIGRDILLGAELLVTHPQIGQAEPRFADLGLGHRYLLIQRRYKVVYRVDGEVVVVTDVFDVRQDPSKMRG